MAGYFQLFMVCSLMFAAQVSGIIFSFNDIDIIIGSTGRLVMTCSVNEPGIKAVYNIQIRRATSLNSPDTELLASIDICDDTPNPTLNPNLNNDKDFIAGGNFDKTNPGSTVLSVDMDIEKLNCADAKEYVCSLNYKDSQDTLSTVQTNGTFSAYVYPAITTLHGKRNDEFIEGSLLSSPASFEVGDQLHLTCTANIGSYEATLIRWRKTSEIGFQDDFIGYQPQKGSLTNGEPSMVSGGCSYMRTTTLTYNTTIADANRDNHLAFECYVSVSGGPYGGGYTTTNNPRFYVNVNGGQAPDQGAIPGKTPVKENDVGVIVGAIVGVVVVVVAAVLLTIFIVYCKRRTRTKNKLSKSKDEIRANITRSEGDNAYENNIANTYEDLQQRDDKTYSQLAPLPMTSHAAGDTRRECKMNKHSMSDIERISPQQNKETETGAHYVNDVPKTYKDLH